jgi:UDPglucose--hexose-1-phosphate uridylyltransferase
VIKLPRHDLRHGSGRRLFVYGRLNGAVPAVDGVPADVDIHKRYDRFTHTWVAVSARRNVRPDDGREGVAACPFCPGGVEVPFPYEGAVFENRFPALVENPPAPPSYPAGPATGRCEVVLYTHAHDGSFATLCPEDVGRVLAMWRDRSAELWADSRHEYVLVFENRGVACGATISHPHGQIYAFDHVPPVQRKKLKALQEHRAGAGSCLACEIVGADDDAPERQVARNESYGVVVPFAARWPFEVHVRARRHGLRRLADLRPDEQLDLGLAIRDVVHRFDALFDEPLPYMMAVQEAPDEAGDDWHLHLEFCPLNRTASQLKVRASVETATGFFINDTLPEASARMLVAIDVPDLRISADVLHEVVPGEARAFAKPTAKAPH